MAQKRLSVYYFKIVPITNDDNYVFDQNRITKAFDLPEDREYENVYQTYGEIGLFGKRKYKNDYVFGTFSFTQTENIPPKQNKTSKITEN